MSNIISRHPKTALILTLIAGTLVYLAIDSLRPEIPEFRLVCGTEAGKIKDEAMCVNRSAETLKGADDDYYADMDNGVTKTKESVLKMAKEMAPFLPSSSDTPNVSAEEIKRRVVIGRNNWIVWTAGNDRFWDQLATQSFGNVDLLKTISNAPNLPYSRDNRWKYLGLVNEPCFKKPTEPDKNRYGLWLDVRDPSCAPDPFEDKNKYPGVKIGARGKNIEVGSYYGYATGIVGLRLFPNPDFDEKAEAKWDWFRYYNDPSYYNNRDLIRPYRVGMSCGFCHVGPSPTNPPRDPNNPQWANLNSNPGAQYFWINRIFTYNADHSDFVYQLFTTSRPGALDTSLVSSDYINNPRTMNAVYSLANRLAAAKQFGKEQLKNGELNNAQFNDFIAGHSRSPKRYPQSDVKVPQGTEISASSALNGFFKEPDITLTPRVLKDGSDSVGALGALNRVYINIGLFGDEWTKHFNPVIGGKKITPIEIEVGRKNSSYWMANEAQTPDVGLFFLATAKPDKLEDAPGGSQYLGTPAQIHRGRLVFAENCAACHSSKLPEKAYTFFPDQGCVGPNYLTCWNNYWKWSRSSEFRKEMRKIAEDGYKQGEFEKDNFFSNDLRIPVTLLETNACSPLATNAIRNNIWDNFSSESYKTLPSVGKYTMHDPYTGKARIEYDMPAGGRGYTRPASLISLWSTAPFLLNNSLGKFRWEGSVEGRIDSFKDSINQLLQPETRVGNVMYSTASGKMVPGQVDLTTDTSYLRLAKGYVPSWVITTVNLLTGYRYATDSGIQIGPIPKGVPVNLISNIDLDTREGWWEDLKHKLGLVKLVMQINHDLQDVPRTANDAEVRKALANVYQPLLDNSKCADYIVNRGHFFGTEYLSDATGEKVKALSPDEREDLIAYLLTL